VLHERLHLASLWLPPRPIPCLLVTPRPRDFYLQLVSIIPDVNVFIKDVNSRWMMCDEGFVSMLGCRTKDVVISKTDTDFIPLHFFEVFLDGDRQVMRTDEPSPNHYEMVLKEDFTLNWYVMWI